MRIGFVNEYFPPVAPGGAEWSTLALAELLAPHLEVVVITPDYGATDSGLDDVAVERYPVPLRPSRGETAVRYGALANPIFYAHCARQVARIARRRGLTVLHAHNKQSFVGTVMAARATGATAVATVRDHLARCRYQFCLDQCLASARRCDLATYRRCVRGHLRRDAPRRGRATGWLRYLTAVYHRLDSRLKRWALRQARAVVFPSRALRAAYAGDFVDADRAAFIPNPLRPGFPPPAADPVQGSARGGILYVGGLSWAKGPELLVRALPIIHRSLATAPTLTLTGSGPLRAPLEELARELGVGGSVVFTGQLPPERVAQLYAAADVVVVPSVQQEPFGRVALEAIACGTPVVVSRRGGLPEIVEDGVTGFVVEPESGALAGAVVEVLSSPAIRTRLRLALPDFRRRYGDDVARAHLELYAAAASQGTSSSGTGR